MTLNNITTTIYDIFHGTVERLYYIKGDSSNNDKLKNDFLRFYNQVINIRSYGYLSMVLPPKAQSLDSYVSRCSIRISASNLSEVVDKVFKRQWRDLLLDYDYEIEGIDLDKIKDIEFIYSNCNWCMEISFVPTIQSDIKRFLCINRGEKIKYMLLD